VATTHPHLTSPDRDDLRRVVRARPAQLVELYLELHDLVLATLPDVVASVDTIDAAIGYGARQYGYDGWGLAAVTPFSSWVSLTLLQGSRLDDPAGLLTGAATMRHVKLRGIDELEPVREAVRDLLCAAATLYSSVGSDSE